MCHIDVFISFSFSRYAKSMNITLEVAIRITIHAQQQVAVIFLDVFSIAVVERVEHPVCVLRKNENNMIMIKANKLSGFY